MKYVRITRRIFGMLGLRMREGALMVALLILYATLEGFGIGLLLPVLQFLESGGAELPSGSVWPYLIAVQDTLGVPINLATLLALAFTPIMLRQGVFYLNTWYNAIVQNKAVERLMVRAFSSIAHAELSFVESQDQGKLLGFVTGQVSRCGTALTQYIRLLSSTATAAVYILLLALLSWQLALIATAAMVGVSVTIRRILIKSRSHGQQVTRASVAMSGAVRERLAALRLVKMRANEDVESQYVGDLAAKLRRATTRIAVASAAIEVIVDPALMLAVFLIIYVGVSAFGMTLSSLGLFMFILLRLNAKIKEVNVGRQQLASLMPSFDYVEATLAEAEAARTPRNGVRTFSGLSSAIEFDNVRFSYAQGRDEVLKGVSLTVSKGSMTAIVGRSGAGKSTLVDMIPLLRRPTSGSVRFDGIPAEEFNLTSLRTRIGFLTQEPILFNASIYANLIYGLDEVRTDAQVRAAVEASYCAEFIDALPDGLQTQLGDRGVRFSGGQRQRLALARVLLQDPDILILDEPTSALDSESEAYVQKAFHGIAEDRTVIVIAHRLATVQGADQIVVLSDGVIVGAGTHRLLYDTVDIYRQLFELQLIKE